MTHMQREANGAMQHPHWGAMLFVVACLVAGLTGVAMFREAHHNAELLTEVSAEIRDFNLSMERHADLGDRFPTTDTSTIVGDTGDVAKSSTKAALIESNEPTATAREIGWRNRDPNQLTPEFEFDYAEYLNRLEGKRPPWTKTEMQAFFEKNAKREGVFALPEGMQYKILRHGDGISPTASDAVLFDFRVFYPDGTEVYSSFDFGDPARFEMENVIPALKQALPRMEEGAQWELYVPPDLVYTGTASTLAKPGSEPMIYVVALRAVIRADPSTDLSQ